MTQRYAHHYSESLRDGVDILDKISRNLAQSGMKEMQGGLQGFEKIREGHQTVCPTARNKSTNHNGILMHTPKYTPTNLPVPFRNYMAIYTSANNQHVNAQSDFVSSTYKIALSPIKNTADFRS